MALPFSVRLVSGKGLSPLQRLLRVFLYPFALQYFFLVGIRNLLYDLRLKKVHKPPVPVISIGNLSAGGTGKTPFTLWLWRELVQRGTNPVIVCRGYGRREDAELNEEAQLLAEAGARVICEPDRVKAVSELPKDCDVVLLDDGFQHRRLGRSLDIVLIDATRPPWKEYFLPAGFLREPMSSLKRADVVVLTRANLVSEPETFLKRLQSKAPQALMSVVEFVPERLDSETGTVPLEVLKGAKVAAFCGIGNPEQFFKSIEGLGARLVCTEVFADHHGYTKEDLSAMEAMAEAKNADFIITTSKDWVKCSPIDRVRKYHILQVTVRPTDGCPELLSKVIEIAGAKVL